MKISFLGAAGTVTGSCFLAETDSCKFMIDCGMFQGHSVEEVWNTEPFPVNPSELDYIILTHAHIDHSGRIPRIFKDGFKGRIITTKATGDLCAIMLPDSGHIQEMEAEWHNRKALRAGKPPVEPLYTFQDAVDCLRLFDAVSYGSVIELNHSLRIRFNDAGHILGSAIVELWVTEKDKEIKLVFTGDIGNSDMPILRDPEIIEGADYLIMESTYGNRLHSENNGKIEKFISIIEDTIKKGGNVVIPSFAVGRTQEIIYDLNKNIEKYDRHISRLMDIPVFIDSPLAISATEVFRNNLDCFDDEARSYIENGDNPLDFPNLKFTRSAEESKALNNLTESAIIISASGMCDAGRIKHHLKHNLWRSDSTILFVGYQAEGTLGRMLINGAQKVRLFGEEITVKARIEMIDGFSGHADREGLLKWLEAMPEKPSKVFVVHGEDESREAFSAAIHERLGLDTVLPRKGEICELTPVRDEPTRMKEVFKPMNMQLEIIGKIDHIKAEINVMSDVIKEDLKNEISGKHADILFTKLQLLEKAIAEVLNPDQV